MLGRRSMQGHRVLAWLLILVGVLLLAPILASLTLMLAAPGTNLAVAAPGVVFAIAAAAVLGVTASVGGVVLLRRAH